MRLLGEITNIVDLGAGATHAVVTADDGGIYTFGLLDSRIPFEDWKVGLRVSFEEGVTSGEAKYVKMFAGDPARGRSVVAVTIDGIKYVPFHHGGDSYTDGVEVSYSYWVEPGWRNYSMEMVPVILSGDLLSETRRRTGHTDYGRSPHVSVFHPKSAIANRAYDIPDLVCDGMGHSVFAVVGFGAEETVRLGAEVSVRVALRVTTGYSGNGVLKEAVAEEMLTITEKSANAHRSAVTANDPDALGASADFWASTERSW